jgi:hypothetical protein
LSLPGGTENSWGSAGVSLAPDGTLFVVEYEPALWAITTSLIPADGANHAVNDFAKWVAPKANAIFTPVIGSDGTIYTGKNIDSYPYLGTGAFQPSNGSNLWFFPAFGPPAIDSNGVLYMANGRTVFAFTNAFGVTNFYNDTNYYFTSTVNVGIKWSYSDTNPYPSAPFFRVAVGPRATVYVCRYDGLLSAFDATSGLLKWTTTTPPISNKYASAPAIGNDGTIYFGTGDYFCAVDPMAPITNGIMNYKWAYTNTGNLDYIQKAWDPVIGPDGTVYVEINASTNELIAFDPASGIPKWMVMLTSNNIWNGESNRGTLAVACDGEIYVADGDGTVYSFSPQGTTNWIYKTGSQSLTAPVIAPDGTIYVASVSWMPCTVFALTGVAPVACSAWPEDGKNSRHTAAIASAQVMSPLITTNGLQLTLSGMTNTSVCPCATTDFSAWTNLGQIVLTNGTANFTDTGTSNYQYRFYRAFPQ